MCAPVWKESLRLFVCKANKNPPPHEGRLFSTLPSASPTPPLIGEAKKEKHPCGCFFVFL